MIMDSGCWLGVWTRSRSERLNSCCAERVSPAAWLGSVSVHLPVEKRPNINQKETNSSDTKRRQRARNKKPTTGNIHANFKIGSHRKRRCGNFNRFHREMTQEKKKKNAETISKLSAFYLDDAAVPPRLAPLLTFSVYLTSEPWHQNPTHVTSQLTRRRWRRWRRIVALGLQDTRSVETSSDNDVKFTPESNGFYWHSCFFKIHFSKA